MIRLSIFDSLRFGDQSDLPQSPLSAMLLGTRSYNEGSCFIFVCKVHIVY